MKKLMSLVLTLILTFTLSPASALAASQETSFSKANIVIVDQCYELSRSIIPQIIAYMEQDNDISVSNESLFKFYGDSRAESSSKQSKQIISDDLLDYIGIKGQLQTKQKNTYNLITENINTTTSLLSSAQSGQEVYLNIAVHVSFNYKNADFSSGYGRIAKMVYLITDDNIVLTDMYLVGDHLDEILRGEISDVESNGRITAKQLGSSGIGQISKSLSNGLDANSSVARFASITAEEIENYQEEMALSIASTYALSKSAIANYARNYNQSTLPPSGGQGVPYRDFYDGNNYDCTNFASHALLAGGAVTREGSGTAWYYKGSGDRSESWSGVQQFYDFMTYNTVRGPYGTKGSYYREPYSTMIDNCQIGDIIQLHNGSKWRHTTIVTGYYSNDGYLYGAVVCGRSGPGQYNNNIAVEGHIYYNYGVRLLQMKGYYM